MRSIRSIPTRVHRKRRRSRLLSPHRTFGGKPLGLLSEVGRRWRAGVLLPGLSVKFRILILMMPMRTCVSSSGTNFVERSIVCLSCTKRDHFVQIFLANARSLAFGLTRPFISIWTSLSAITPKLDPGHNSHLHSESPLSGAVGFLG